MGEPSEKQAETEITQIGRGGNSALVIGPTSTVISREIFLVPPAYPGVWQEAVCPCAVSVWAEQRDGLWLPWEGLVATDLLGFAVGHSVRYLGDLAENS